MKVRNYEKKELVMIGVILLFLLESIFVFSLFLRKEYIYQKFVGVVIKENYLLLLVDSSEKKLLYASKKFYFKDKMTKYVIEEDRGDVLKKGHKKYYELVLKAKIGKKYKVNDTIECVLKEKKVFLIEMLKKVWGGS